MRARLPLPGLNVPRPVRVGLLAVFGIVLAALAAWWAGTDRPDEGPRLPASVATAPVDPLVAEFRRCQALGEAGAHDPDCLAAWAENRRRFLGLDRRPLAPNPQAAPPAATER